MAKRLTSNEKAMTQRQRYTVAYNSAIGYYVADTKAARGEERGTAYGDNAGGALAEAATLNGLPNPAVLRCKISRAATQATRTTPAGERTQWILFTPAGPVSCPSADEAVKLAATFGKTISVE